ncbi:MAG: monofunctional biosynthetic peptidoglycan transglycosylase [Pseudomonadota bacterium]
MRLLPRLAPRWRARLGIWGRRFVTLVIVLFVVVPVVLTAAYRVVPVPATPLMVIRLFEGEGWQRDWVPLHDVAETVGVAVIAGEDNLFCENRGFDWGEVADAWTTWRAGGRLRGASTISMQVARNLFLWPGGGFIRKAVEVYETSIVELILPKSRIMEIYLNIAEWGPGIYGVGAAARHYFGLEAADLTSRQASLLVAILPAPRSRSAARPTNYVQGYANTIHRRMGQLGPLTDCILPSS